MHTEEGVVREGAIPLPSHSREHAGTTPAIFSKNIGANLCNLWGEIRKIYNFNLMTSDNRKWHVGKLMLFCARRLV